MAYVLAALVALGTVLLAVGAITGRVTARTCCSPVKAEDDARLRG